mgnify:CR=1 FL=1
MASAQANNLLFPCTDFRRELSMEYCFDDMAPIKVHPECVFMATANLGSQYTGTHKLDRALIDRFMLMQVDPLDKDNAVEVVKYHNPKLKDDVVENLVKCYMDINKAHDNFEISFKLSMRHLGDIAALVSDGFTSYDSFYTICRGIGGNEGVKSLKTILTKSK